MNPRLPPLPSTTLTKAFAQVENIERLHDWPLRLAPSFATVNCGCSSLSPLLSPYVSMLLIFFLLDLLSFLFLLFAIVYFYRKENFNAFFLLPSVFSNFLSNFVFGFFPLKQILKDFRVSLHTSFAIETLLLLSTFSYFISSLLCFIYSQLVFFFFLFSKSSHSLNKVIFWEGKYLFTKKGVKAAP